MCFRNRWEGRCDRGYPYWICGKEQQYYSSWLKRTKTLTRFIEADFIITMMSWSYILMSHLFSCKITACKATSHWRQNKLSATRAFKLVYSFSYARPWTAHFLIHSINKTALSLATDAMAFGLPVTPYNSRISCFTGCFPHSQNQPCNSPLQICIAGRMHFSKKELKTTWQIGTKSPTNLSLNRVFHKLDNNKWKMHTGARAREQKYISIYISLCLKTFLKTGVYIYITLDFNTGKFKPYSKPSFF